MIRTSYLRVYQPRNSFPEEEVAGWIESSETSSHFESTSLRWLIARAMPLDESVTGPGGAFIRTVEGQVMVCPWRTRLRMLAGLIAFRGSLPEEVADAFVPEPEARRAAHELATLGESHPEVRSHILHTNWHVPLRWFAAFDDSERILVEDRNGLRVRYETTLSSGRARLTKALEVLEQSWMEESIIDAVRELLEWLNGFSEEGLLELDYGSVAATFADDDLVEDHSAAEIWTCLDALAAGDLIRAGRTFAGLTDRWTEVRAQEVLN